MMYKTFAKRGQLDRALDVLARMEQQGTAPSVDMYKALLKTCTKRRAIVEAKRIHAHLTRHRPDSARDIGEYLVSTFVKCGDIEAALDLFQRLPERTVLSWTALISGYALSGQGQEAMRMYQRMQKEGVQPNKYTFVSLLKSCGTTFDLEEGRRIHAESVKYRCEGDLFVSTSLVDMYAKCGSIVDAQHVFNGLSQRDVVSWNAMLAAHALQGQPEEAWNLYEIMQDEGISPDDRTFVKALQVCGILAEKEKGVGKLTQIEFLERGKTIHFEAWRRGYESDIFISNSLITMYARCGSTLDAHTVFDSLSQRDVVSWTAMLSAYTQNSEGKKALQLYDQMQVEGIVSDGWIFVSALQACCIVADLEKVPNGHSTKLKYLQIGRAIHAEAWSKGYKSDLFISNTLVSMYGKCGSVVDAQIVFNGLASKNVVSWNAMLAAYIQQGQAEKAMEIYAQMCDESISSDALTFVTALQACALLAEEEDVMEDEFIKACSFKKGKALHAEACVRGHESDVLVGSALICMYGKCGSLTDSRNFFDRMFQRSVVSWNAMFVAYIQQGKAETVLELLELMPRELFSLDDSTFVSALQACAILAERENDVDVCGHLIKVKSLHLAKAIHAEAWVNGHRSGVFIDSALISVYAKCGSIMDACNVFHVLPHPNVVSWNAMLAGYVQQDQAKEALELYSQMLHEVVSPDALTFVSTLQACGMLADEEEGIAVDGLPLRVKCLERGRALHYDAWKKGYETDAFIVNTLVSTYGKCGSVVDAQIVFDGLSVRDVVSCNAMLAAHAQQGQTESALNLYMQMQEDSVIPDDITVVCILKACSNMGSFDVCSQIHQNLVSAGKELSPLLANSLIHAYASCASLADAENVFRCLPQADVVSWTALIAGYSRQGYWETSLQYYQKMQVAGVKPNGVTFLSVLAACSHGGLVAQGLEYFESMSRDHGIFPNAEHYVTIVDLLGRAGYFSRIEDLLSTMPVQPTLTMWLCLLGACRKHGKLVLGRLAFDCAVRLQPKHSAPYMLMSNMYANAQLWDNAREVDELRQTAGASKKPGQSWLSKGLEVHTFVVGEGTREESLYEMVQKVSSKLREQKEVLSRRD